MRRGWLLALLVAGCGGGGGDVGSDAMTGSDGRMVDAPQPGVTITPLVLTIDEGGSGMVSITPDGVPPSPLVVTLVSMDPSRLMATPEVVTFVAQSAQMVELRSLPDPDPANDTVMMEVTSPGKRQTLMVTITDKTAQSLLALPASLTIREGMSASFAVRLMSEPSGPVRVDVTSAAPAHASVTPASLDFTTTNYNMPQYVQVTAVEDADSASEQVDMRVTSSGLTAVMVRVTTQDND